MRCRLALLVALTLASIAGTASADTIITGGNVINQTWSPAGSPYVIQGDITVPVGAFLIIDAGTVVQFAATDGQAAGVDTARVELVVKGTLTVNGTTLQPVTMRGATASPGSWYGLEIDAAATGTALTAANLTINHAYNAIFHRSTATVSTAAISIANVANVGVLIEAGTPTYNGVSIVGGSNGFLLQSAGGGALTNCLARGTSNAGVRFVPSSGSRGLTITNCTFDSNGTYGVFMSAGSLGSLTISNSIVTNSQYGLYRNDSSTFTATYNDVWKNTSNDYFSVTASPTSISSNPLFVSSSNLRLTANSPARFAGSGGGDLGPLPYVSDPTPGLYGVLWTPTTFTAAGSPYTVGGDLTVGPGVTVTIEPGATLAFAAADNMLSGVDITKAELVVAGTLNASGTAALPITLRGVTASPGSWYGVVIAPGVSGTSLTLANVTIDHPYNGVFHRSATAALSTSAVSITNVANVGVLIEAGTPTYNGVSIVGGSNGFLLQSAGGGALTNCLARGTSNAGVRFVPSSGSRGLTITNCTFDSNGTYGVFMSAGSLGSLTISNSIVTNSQYGLYRNDSSTFTATYNDVWNNTSNNYFSVTASPTSISQNPQFVSATNLRLQSSSVCIDAGTATGAPTRDILGTTRPLDGDGINTAEFDMGAYEFVRTVVCGNGAVEPGETCDSGAANGTYGACNATCTGLGPRCGDGTTNGPETCDDANASNTDGCLTTCVVATCGDGFVHGGVETCDDSNTVNTDGCTATCQLATCGDGIVRAGFEQCDDANAVNTDGCVAGCVLAACGDGFLRGGVETCDDGNLANTDACLATCVPATCGDGFIQGGVEACDDMNSSNLDGCVGSCALARCGDGFVHTGIEACDDGNTNNTDACSNTCTAPTCGDGVVQAGEECDDSNTVDTDGCRSNCMAARCGDGVIRTGVETCDDGNTVNTDACTATCQPATCGDGILFVGSEECDDANASNTDACVTGCVAARCGDTFVRTGVEACDDGNTNNADTCTNACALSTCGDGTVQAGEECDDANQVDTDACRNTCLAARCGDGVIRTGVETCDDSNTMAGDGCSMSCQIESPIDAGVDAPIGVDAGIDPNPPGDGGGCCSSSRGGRESGALGLLMIAFGLGRRRRRRDSGHTGR